MVQRLSDAENEQAPSANREHNSKARGDAIRKLNKDLIPLESKKAEIQEEIRGLRQAFKGDTNITLADFDAARRLVMIEDDDERGTKMDNIRECFNALSEGDQLDWVQAAAKEEAAAAE